MHPIPGLLQLNRDRLTNSSTKITHYSRLSQKPMVTPSQVAEMIQTGLPDAKLKVEDLRGGDHYQVRVVSAAFEGKSRVQQHQLVYGALKQAMASEAIHALALETLTPAEWEAKNQVA